MKSCNCLLLLALLINLFAGCAMQQPTSDPSLPTVKGIKYLSDIDTIALEWESLSNFPQVSGYYLYRRSMQENDYKLIATIPSRFSTHHVDTQLLPDSTYIYRIATYNDQGAASIASEPIQISTQSLAPLTFAKAIGNYPRKIKLLWTPHPDLRVQGYLIQRAEGDNFITIKRINNRLDVEYLDTHLKDNTEYHYRIFALSTNNIRSAPTPTLSAKTKATPLPPQGIFASFDLPKKIKINWQASLQKDIVAYRIYRSVLGGISKELIKEIPANETAFIDQSDVDGVHYGYFVDAVDKDGLVSEAQKNPVVGRTLPAPNPPIIQSAGIENGKVALRWDPNNQRNVQYVINKQGDSFFTKKERYVSIPYTYFYDGEITPGEKYLYNVIAIDQYGLESAPSETVSITIPRGH